jgi:hypothetical protein
VTRIFYGSDYLSIAKEEKVDWDQLKPEIFRIVSDFFDTKRALLADNAVLGTILLTKTITKSTRMTHKQSSSLNKSLLQEYDPIFRKMEAM